VRAKQVSLKTESVYVGVPLWWQSAEAHRALDERVASALGPRRRTGAPLIGEHAATHERMPMQCGDEHASVEMRNPFGARLAERIEWRELDPSAATRAPRRVRQNQPSGTNYAFSATAGQPQFVSWTDVSDNEIVDGFKLRERGNADRRKAGAHQLRFDFATQGLQLKVPLIR
jgi:hypothetical protein